jgi:hypothetical protein
MANKVFSKLQETHQYKFLIKYKIANGNSPKNIAKIYNKKSHPVGHEPQKIPPSPRATNKQDRYIFPTIFTLLC